MPLCSISMRIVQLINLGQTNRITNFAKPAVDEKEYWYKPRKTSFFISKKVNLTTSYWIANSARNLANRV